MLDVAQAGTANGSPVHQWDYLGKDNQLWAVQPVKGGFVKLKSVLSGKVLDIAGIAAGNGARVQIWEDVNGDNQLWRLTEVKPETAPAQQAEKPAAKRPRKRPRPQRSQPQKKIAPAKKAATAKKEAPAVKKAEGSEKGRPGPEGAGCEARAGKEEIKRPGAKGRPYAVRGGLLYAGNNPPGGVWKKD